MSNPAVSLKGITKVFGLVRANDNVDLSVTEGTIHGIIGENGAGKSTLVSILSGHYRADAGEIALFGEPVKLASSALLSASTMPLRAVAIERRIAGPMIGEIALTITCGFF